MKKKDIQEVKFNLFGQKEEARKEGVQFPSFVFHLI